ncbi:MAG: rod shape-determining protein [Velocimicrobium sp.]
MSKRMFGIDLGTSKIKIYKRGEGIVLDQSNAIAIANKKNLIAVGDEANEMYEKVPISISVSYPVKCGVIAEIAHMQMLLNYFFDGLIGKKTSIGSTVEFLVAVPTDITEVEKKSFYDLIANSNVKSKNIGMVEKPIATALGMGLDIYHAHGILTVDFGAETTEISILSLGGIVLSKLIPIGGRKIDESIKVFIKKRYNLVIGDKTSEYIKMNLVSAFPQEKESIFVCGRNVVTGLPCEMEIFSEEVNEVVSEHLITVIEAVRVILERTPPEISADIYRSGIYLTGGSAKLRNLDQLFTRETALKVNVVDDPENTVANGLGELVENVGSSKLSANVIKTFGKKSK